MVADKHSKDGSRISGLNHLVGMNLDTPDMSISLAHSAHKHMQQLHWHLIMQDFTQNTHQKMCLKRSVCGGGGGGGGHAVNVQYVQVSNWKISHILEVHFASKILHTPPQP